MRTRLERLGRARAVILPESMIREAGLGDHVVIETHGRSVVIRAPRVREGWAEDAARAAAAGQSRLLDPPAATRFDAEQWDW